MNSLAAKALASLVKRALIFGVLLFVPAWSLHFWQAWAYLVLCLAAQLLIAMYLWRNDPSLLDRRLKGGPTAESRSRQKAIMSVVSLSVTFLVVVAGYDHRFNWSHVAAPLVIAAEAGLLLGFLIQFYAFKANSFASAVVAIDPSQRLSSTGPYAVVRHPMYSGALVVNVFTPIALGSWWGLPFAFAWLSAIILRILDEEALLRQSLAGYEEYCRKVQYRLIPHIW
jgi:protein-S-isoprenylcysteine O-methyltransferase Ste14